jgi:hypothetical protein
MLAMLILPAALAGVSSAQATTFIPRPFPAHVQDAPLIVRGKVGTVYSDWVATSDGGKRIYTFTEIQLTEVLKGKVAGSSIQARELGGEKDGLGMQVPGTAQFDRGEDVVVLLGERNGDGSHDMQGMMMGKFNVVRDPGGREVLTGGALSFSGHVHDAGQGQDGANQDKKTWSLDDLRELIRSQEAASEASRRTGEQANPLRTAAPSSAMRGGAPPSPAPERAASGLQPQDPGTGRSTGIDGIWTVGLAIGAALLILGYFLFR